jgi:hypothetical protein
VGATARGRGGRGCGPHPPRTQSLANKSTLVKAEWRRGGRVWQKVRSDRLASLRASQRDTFWFSTHTSAAAHGAARACAAVHPPFVPGKEGSCSRSEPETDSIGRNVGECQSAAEHGSIDAVRDGHGRTCSVSYSAASSTALRPASSALASTSLRDTTHARERGRSAAPVQCHRCEPRPTPRPIEAPWLVNGGHGASLKQPFGLAGRGHPAGAGRMAEPPQLSHPHPQSYTAPSPQARPKPRTGRRGLRHEARAGCRR